MYCLPQNAPNKTNRRTSEMSPSGTGIIDTGGSVENEIQCIYETQ